MKVALSTIKQTIIVSAEVHMEPIFVFSLSFCAPTIKTREHNANTTDHNTVTTNHNEKRTGEKQKGASEDSYEVKTLYYVSVV